jgi:hypothetical protein
MNDTLIINGVTYHKVEEPKEDNRIELWANRQCLKHQGRINIFKTGDSYADTKLIEIRDNERILSMDDIRSAWINNMNLVGALKSLGFDK